MKKLLLFLLVLFATATLVTAVQPTLQTNKILMSPYYFASLTSNTNYTGQIVVNTPDDISSVVSALINIHYIVGNTPTLTLWVNGQACNNPTYSISSNGAGDASFDCTNIITREGTYNLTIRPSANTGSIYVYLDLTYMNAPFGYINVHGTEYIPGEQGKMFLQFLDSSQQPIGNSACTLTIWYPNNTKVVDTSAMTYLDEGIYYYNLNVPTSIGVYPASAKCYYPGAFTNATILNNVTEGFETNTWTGGTGWANHTGGTNGWDYYSAALIANASAGTGGCYAGSYCAQLSGVSQSAQYLERGFITPTNARAMNITFYVKSTLQSGDSVEFDVFDGTWHQSEIYYGSNFTAGTWYKKSYLYTVENGFYLDSTAILMGWFGVSWTASNRYLYIDNISVSYIVYNTSISNQSAYQILRGSGEIHVSALYPSLNTSISNATTPAAIWAYANRTLTATAVNYSAVADAVWNATTRNLTYYPTQVDLTNYSRISNLTASDVWTYLNRNLTYYPIATVDTNAIAIAVWNATTRNLTYYQNFTVAQIDMTNYSRISNLTSIDVWTYTNRNLTYYPTQVDLTNYSRISNLTANDVWNYLNRNLTYYPTATVDVNAIAIGVWNATTRNLTYYPPVVIDNSSTTIIATTVATQVWNDTGGRYVNGIIN